MLDYFVKVCRIVLLSVHLRDACAIAAVVVHKDHILVALGANVSNIVDFASENVNIALAIIQMVVCDALFTLRAIQRVSLTAS